MLSSSPRTAAPKAIGDYKLQFGPHRGEPLNAVPPLYLRLLLGESWVHQNTRELIERFLKQQGIPLTAEAGPPPAEPQPDPPHQVTSEILDRMPPADVEAEQCLVGSLMIRPELLERVATIIQPEHFYAEHNRILYETLAAVRSGDVILLRAVLKRYGKLEDIGGDAYLADCARAVPIASNAPQYAAIVREKYLLRRIAELGERLVQRGYADDSDPASVAREAVSELEHILSKASEACPTSQKGLVPHLSASTEAE